MWHNRSDHLHFGRNTCRTLAECIIWTLEVIWSIVETFYVDPMPFKTICDLNMMFYVNITRNRPHIGKESLDGKESRNKCFQKRSSKSDSHFSIRTSLLLQKISSLKLCSSFSSWETASSIPIHFIINKSMDGKESLHFGKESLDGKESFGKESRCKCSEIDYVTLGHRGALPQCLLQT